MLFTDSFITDDGVLLFARATAQSKLLWTRAATSSKDTDSYTIAQMNALNTDSFGPFTSSGSVTNAIVNDAQSSASIYSELTNAEYSGSANLFGAWAKIEGDQDDVLVIVARCGAGVTPTVINPASDGIVKAFVDFELQISAVQAQSLEVTESNYYATSQALEDEQDARESLAQRIVTTHSAEDPTTGDDQTILGTKTFQGTVVLEGALSAKKSTSTSHFDIRDSTTSGTKGGSIWLIEDASYYGGFTVTRYSGYTQTSLFTDDGGRLLLKGGSSASTKYANLTVDGQTGIIMSYNSTKSEYEITTTAPLVIDEGVSNTVNFAKGLTGIAPKPSLIQETVGVPIGGIVAVWFPSAMLGVAKVGESFTASARAYYVAYNNEGTMQQGSEFIPAGTYVNLMERSSQSGATWGLMQRIE